MNPRRMNTHIDIARKRKLQDTASGQFLTTYPPLHRKVPAQRIDTSGGSNVRGLQVEAETIAVFRMRHPDILQTDQIHDSGEFFNIVKIITREGEADWRWVECSKV